MQGWTGSHDKWLISIYYNVGQGQRVEQYKTSAFECSVNHIDTHIAQVASRGFPAKDCYVPGHRILRVTKQRLSDGQF